MTSETRQLTDEQIAHFHAQGYLQLERLVAADEVAWVREIYDRLFATSAHPARVRAVKPPSHSARRPI
jgi:hypothetical protein